MRDTTSCHTVSIRATSDTILPGIPRFFRPNLNVPLLTKLLSTSAPSRGEKGKRKAPRSELPTRPTKRTKTSHGSQDEDNSDTDSSSTPDFESPLLQDYPRVSVTQNNTVRQELHPILRHTIDINFTRQDVDRSNQNLKLDVVNGLDLVDQHLIEVLEALRSSSPSVESIDLASTEIATWNDRLVMAVRTNKRSELADWLLLLPSVSIDAAAYDFSEPQVSDLLQACYILQAAGKLDLQTTLKALITPLAAEGASEMLPISLRLEIVASLPFPHTLDYQFPKRSTKKFINTVEDAQRRLLRAAFEVDPPSSVGDAISVASFYSIMGPAPPLSDEVFHAMQPDLLKPNLLPFQRRSAAWLLEKEGMYIHPDGTVVAQASTDAFSFTFWKEATLGNRVLYVNQLSGVVVEEKPEMPAIYGGMLAEEPGLGKTLETIGLILLNPAPPDWNPSVTRWDEIARLDVRPVKTSLIVTPPSLVSQWQDELTNHAPSLKVLVYDGWTKVTVPIVKSDRERARVAKLRAELDKVKKRNLKAKEKAKQKQKREKKKGKGKQRQTSSATDSGSDDDSMDVASEEEDEPNEEDLDWPEYVHGFDIVITTYSVLRSEIWVARPAPDRPRRAESLYTSTGRTRSPLVMVEWKRVVMDEVQMVGGGQAAEMVSLIPRLSSLAVSGTPAKAQMSDLIHVLKFLRIDQIVGNTRLWNRLLKPGYAPEFTAFLQHYGIRTTKAAVTDELTIPQQTRYLVSIDLGKVERHVYDQTLETVLLELGLDARGVAASAGWTVNSATLRAAIRRLRGICTHPQVGQLQRRGDGLYKPGALKTMEAVLEAMREQNWRNMMDDWKSKIQLIVRVAQLSQHDERDGRRYQKARDALAEAETEIRQHIEELKDVIAAHDVKGKELKAEAAKARQKAQETAGQDDTIRENSKGKGKARQIDSDEESASEAEDVEDEDEAAQGLPKTPAGKEHRDKRSALQHRLREARVMLHKVKFLQGDVYHVLGNSADEDAGYHAAEELRRELLKGTETEATKAIDVLNDNANRKRLSEDELMIDIPFLKPTGLLARTLVEELNELLEDVFNKQSELAWEWRAHILSILTKPLASDEKQSADGQEYQRTLDDQGEVETYMQVYSALLADRRQALVNERTLLAEHEIREKKQRKTKAALKATGGLQALLALVDTDDEDDELNIGSEEGAEVQPEHQVLHKELSDKRKELLLPLNGRSVRSILVDISNIHSKISNEKQHPERIIVKAALDAVRHFISEQNSMHEKLDQDLRLIRAAFNRRIQYFRQLQEISDSVADVEWEEPTVALAIEFAQAERADLDDRINTTRARHRYLANIAQDDSDDEDDKACILCRCEFTRGFITQCAHIFCEGCMKMWIAKREGKTCPVCRVAIDPDSLQRFTINEEKAEPPPRPVNGEPVPQSRREIVYNRISPALVATINEIETHGSFGSKIQFLVRHLLHIQMGEPGAKSIVFSAWADSLQIVEIALRTNGIRTLRIDQTSKGEHAAYKFRKDPEISVLLLHGERENAGLNITCASRVFLLESVVHHSFEIQAIARIDRLGQTRPTEVYCYYAEDTVERNILDLAARKGLSLYTKDNAMGTVNVSTFANEVEQAVDDPSKVKAQQKGDFIYKVDDMLAILFPHMFEDVEYLLPPDGDVLMAESDPSLQRISTRGGIEANAVAGPSRLPS